MSNSLTAEIDFFLGLGRDARERRGERLLSDHDSSFVVGEFLISTHILESKLLSIGIVGAIVVINCSSGLSSLIKTPSRRKTTVALWFGSFLSSVDSMPPLRRSIMASSGGAETIKCEEVCEIIMKIHSTCSDAA
jgi:hypothetical protein